MKNKPNILLICSEPFTAVWAYLSLSVINALKNSSFNIYFIYQKVDSSIEYEQLLDQAVNRIPFQLPKNKIFKTLIKIFPFHVLLKIKRLHKDHPLTCAHSLSTGYLLKNIIPLFKESIPFIYTVHDAILHPTTNKSLMIKYIRRSEQKNIRSINNLSTCSKFQIKYLQSKFPHKNLFYFRMPLHISENIIHGTEKCNELANASQYILFFGNISLYKGIDILIESFYKSSSLSKSVKLVIAGAGNYRPKGIDHQNIIFINRHINDSEIRSLFENARCVVYPYTSITQTAVVQYAYFFKVPVIASDLDYFKDCIIDGKTGFLFENKNVNKLTKLLESFYSNSFNPEPMKAAMAEQFEKCYSLEGLAKELTAIYECFKKKDL